MVATMAVSTFADTYPVNSDTLKLRVGGGQGLSVSGNKVIFNLANNDGNPAFWSVAQMMDFKDDLSDGFTVKISNIKWDAANNNSIAVVYGNGSFGGSNACENGTSSNFTLLVKKDGSLVFWGNGYNVNHVWGKWTPIYVHNKTLGKSVTEFTYSMVPNADKTLYTFYVNNVPVYDYDLNSTPGNHDKSIFASSEKCNLGFQVFDGYGNANAGFSSPKPKGTLEFTIEEVNTVGIAPENIEIPTPPPVDDPVVNDTTASDTDASDETTKRGPVTQGGASVTTATPGTTAPVTDGNANQNNTTTIIIIAVAAVAALAIVAVVIIVLSKNNKKPSSEE